MVLQWLLGNGLHSVKSSLEFPLEEWGDVLRFIAAVSSASDGEVMELFVGGILKFGALNSSTLTSSMAPFFVTGWQTTAAADALLKCFVQEPKEFC